MRRATSEASTAVLAAGLALWVTFFNADHNSPWLLPIAISWIVALIGKVAVSIPSPGRGKGPDFRLTWRSPQMWEIERIRRQPAEDIRQGDGINTTTDINFATYSDIGVLTQGERVLFGTANDEGMNVPFTWREGSKRFYSKSVHLARGSGPFDLVGIEWKAGEKIHT